MKKKLLFVGVAFMALSTMQAQDGVGIGKSIIPDGSAVLDIGATDKGVLIPRVALTGETDATTIKGAAPSLLVFNTATTAGGLKPGYYFWLDGKWNALVSKTTEKTDETLTSLKIVEDLKSKELTLLYVDESGLDNTLPISEELQKNDKFQDWIASQVTQTATGVTVAPGAGIHVKDEPNGANGIKYIISADPSGIALTGEVEGFANATKIADDAVTTTKIKDKAVTFGKIEGGTDGQLLSSEGGVAKWINQTDIVPAGEDLTTDDIIMLNDGTNVSNKVQGAVLKATKLTIKDRSIANKQVADNTLTVEKLATVDTNKNNRLVTDNAGKPVWESKYTTISSTPVATNEVMDDKKVYTVKFDNAVVEEGQPGVGYNTAIKALPKIDNLEYLLRAEIYDGANKLVVSSVTDVVNTDGVLTFRFGMNKMYSTLPAATNYKVVLKYVSTEAVVTP